MKRKIISTVLLFMQSKLYHVIKCDSHDDYNTVAVKFCSTDTQNKPVKLNFTGYLIAYMM